MIYALTQYMVYKKKSFDVLNKVRDGNVLSEQEIKIWDRYKKHLETLSIIDQKGQIDAMERRANKGKNIIIGGTVLTTAAVIAAFVFIPPLAPFVGALGSGATQVGANNQLTK